jgi:hypothetical protein
LTESIATRSRSNAIAGSANWDMRANLNDEPTQKT